MDKLLADISSFYFVGIGGVSMSSLATIFKTKEKKVGGYDYKPSETTKRLSDCGICVNYEKNINNSKGYEACVYTAAIKEDDPELIFAKQNCKYVFSRAKLLGMITGAHACSIGVAGTHGKSTTTGMLAQIALNHDSDCTILGGAFIPAINSLYQYKNSDLAVFEACEYKNSYHEMQPTIKVVLNCQHDHVDFFPTIDDVVASFHKYIDTQRESGGKNIAVVNKDCKNACKAAQNTNAEVYYYSTEEKCDFYARNISLKNGCGCFDIYNNDSHFVHVELKVPGLHNVQNACAACAAASVAGISAQSIQKGLCDFCGVSRRFEIKGTVNGATIADDYAHHPDEILATLKAARLMGFKRIIGVFQPHTYSRTKALLGEFASALGLCDIAVLSEIYSARELNTDGVSSLDIAKLIPGAKYFESFEQICAFIKQTACEGDLVITMGAGNINVLCDMIKDI